VVTSEGSGSLDRCFSDSGTTVAVGAANRPPQSPLSIRRRVRCADEIDQTCSRRNLVEETRRRDQLHTVGRPMMVNHVTPPAAVFGVPLLPLGVDPLDLGASLSRRQTAINHPPDVV
jgi:hypothetical protein